MRGDIIKSNFNETDFDWISGSNVWPSNDPLDSPFDIFRCTRCEWEFRHATSGRWIGLAGQDPKEFYKMALNPAEEAARLHHESRCEYITYPPAHTKILIFG